MPIATSGVGTATVADIIDETRRHLHGSSTGSVLNVLDGALTDTATTVTLADTMNGVKAGTVLEIDYEQMYVRSVSGQDCTVLRGHNASTADTHADGSIIRVNPSYYALDIFKAVQDEFAALNGTGLRQFREVEIAFNGSDQMYDLGFSTPEPVYVHRALWEPSTTRDTWRPVSVELVRGANTADFASGYALRVLGFPFRTSRYSALSTTATIRVTVGCNFVRPSSPSTTISESSVGTNEVVVPIVAAGAAWRLLLGKEAQRVNPDWSHGSRRGEEVPAGSVGFAARAIQSMKDSLIRDALEHQYSRYAPRQEM